jgi:hypothetical protein
MAIHTSALCLLLVSLILPIWHDVAHSQQLDSDLANFSRPAFWGTRLINMPTTHCLDKGELLFRISHRFDLSMSKGHEYLYGLDGPAKILLSLGYGLREDISLTLGRTNLNDVMEVSCQWLMFRQRGKMNLPFSAVLHIGGSLVTQLEPCHDLLESRNMKFNAQLCLSHQRSESVSLLLVPAYSSNTNHWETNPRGTFILGTGGRYTFIDNLSLIGEWLPVLSGYEAESTGWGVGLEYKSGGHVFQLFLTDALGLTSDQYVPGGDLNVSDGDIRLGFNIFRSFWF